MTKSQKPTAKFEMIEVTPMIAEALLKTLHPNQRRKDQRHISKIASDMTDDRYLFTGDSIVIDWDGFLINGQHRLNAILISGVSQWMLVVSGVDPKAITVIDNNAKPRTLTDVMRILGGNVEKPIIDAIVFAAAGGDRDKALSMSNPERVELTFEITEDLIRLMSVISQSAVAGLIRTRPLLAESLMILKDLGPEDQSKMVDFMIATYKNDGSHPSFNITSNQLYRQLLKLKSQRKNTKKSAQDNDDHVRYAVRKGCELFLSNKDATPLVFRRPALKSRTLTSSVASA